MTIGKRITDDIVGGSTMKKCERCGMEFNADYAFCPSCGGGLVEYEPTIEDLTEETVELTDDFGVTEETVELTDDSGVTEEDRRNLCPKCGTEIPEGYVFCPECGTKVAVGSAAEERIHERKTPIAASSVTNGEKKKIAKGTKIIIGCCAVALLICIGIIAIISSPKELILNSGEPINLYVGDEATVSLSGEGLSDADYQTALWTTDDSEVLTVENGKIKASYDSDLFNEITGEGEEEDMDPCSCSTFVNAKIKKGTKKWEGFTEVIISLEPVKVESGAIIKEPADSRTSSLTVTPSDDYNTYFYLESKTKKSNDMSFIIKKGEETTVSIPADKYIMYWAQGDTWYGGDFLFGPQTTYQKDSEEWDFANYTWTLQQETEDGNMSDEAVDEEDFPEL